jgi:Leucine-rich repeat (LRR) protein
LEKLPAALGGLTALREMDLSGCESLKELPEDLGALKKLKKIRLRGCKSLEKLPAALGFCTHTATRKMDLSGCESLKELPAELGALKELQTIYLCGCKSLEKLPAGIGGLTALREIVLSGCESLKELPAELGALTQLNEIELRGCNALHTPPPHVVRQGTGAVLQFLRDLTKNYAPCHLINTRDMMEVLEDLNTRSLAGRSLVWLQNCKASASKFVDHLTAAADSMRVAVPDSFRCPITQDVMVDPVIVFETGHTYERSAIETWLHTHNTDPKTNVQLRSKNLVPNHSLRTSIEEFSANNGAGLSP